ncbi:MAG: DNA polymerase III subunit gamma/tau [Clostridiales bacterium]|nr:DNA polymerase III subunit gamma/tau [Clostridiales bacterium]
MSYKALYREWRPQKFEEVVGQKHIVTTLINQITNENISHAYLFSGTRGTGKTTVAKIFARTLNCVNVDKKNINPCNSCELCVGIINESIMDVIEIDAASNNGVDHIRMIRENVRYTPARGKYKVYIVDEVHMLSIGAFNALLKTLEEPPEHVIFILATTEPHKLPVTIISRCQRFNFRPVKSENISKKLNEVCQSLKIECEKKALMTIASNSKGSLRDALSILEQCIAFVDKKLTYEKVIETLGITNELLLKELVEAIIENKVVLALSQLHKTLSEGNDANQLIKQLIDFFRGLLMVKLKVPQGIEYSESAENNQMFYNITNEIDVDRIVKIMNILTEYESKAKYSTQAQIILEIAIVTLCKEQSGNTVEELEERIKKIEELINSIQKPKAQRTRKSGVEEVAPAKVVSENKRGNPEEIDTEKRSKDDKQKENSNIHEYKRTKNKTESNKRIEIDKVWDRVLDTIIRDKKAHLKAFLREGKFQKTDDNRVVIKFREGFGFHCATLNKEENKEYLLDLLYKITGEQIDLSFIMEDEANKRELIPSKDVEKQLGEILPTEIFEVLE